MSRRTQLLTLYPRINTRVTGPFLMVIVLLAVMGILIISRLIAGNIEERLANQLADGAQAAVNTVVDVEEQMLATLRAMAFTTGVDDALTAGDVATLETLILPVAANNGVDQLLAVNAAGETIVHRVRDAGDYLLAPPPDTAGWPLVQQVIHGGSDRFGDKFVAVYRDSEPVMFYFAATVANDDGSIAGGLLAGISGDHLVRVLREQSISNIVLYDEGGTVLAASFRDATQDSLLLSPETVTGVLENPDETSRISHDIRIEGLDYRFLYAPFSLRSVQIGVLGTALPVDFVADRVGTARNSFFMLFAASAFAVALIGLVVSRSIVRPVHHMVNMTRQIRAGDLNSRIELTTPDELGELGRSVDHMTGRLLEQNHEIRVLYDEQIKETARRDAVLAGIADAVIVLDMGGGVMMANETAQNLLARLDADPDPPVTYRIITGATEQFYAPQTATLYDRHYSLLATPVRLDSGATLGHVVVLRDITALIEAEALKDDIILQLSHELRTPLTASRGYIDLLRLFGADSDQAGTFIVKSIEQLDVLGDMIQQVIEVSATLSTRLELTMTRINLSALLEDLAHEHLPKMEAGELAFTAHIPDAVWICGDGNHLMQAIGQVLKNAYSYTLPDGQVGLSLRNDGSTVTIRVKDTGVGIDEDEIERVFDKLYRGRSADAGPTDTRGMGLGLYVARQIIDAHHGSIHLQSRAGSGTLVTIRLPGGNA